MCGHRLKAPLGLQATESAIVCSSPYEAARYDQPEPRHPGTWLEKSCAVLLNPLVFCLSDRFWITTQRFLIFRFFFKHKGKETKLGKRICDDKDTNKGAARNSTVRHPLARARTPFMRSGVQGPNSRDHRDPENDQPAMPVR